MMRMRVIRLMMMMMMVIMKMMMMVVMVKITCRSLLYFGFRLLPPWFPGSVSCVCCRCLQLIHFFTAGADECKAWSLKVCAFFPLTSLVLGWRLGYCWPVSRLGH
jgi:hypothetical protein